MARALRRRQTDPERLLWSKLRNRGLAGAKFRRQWPIAGYVTDFCCVEVKLVVEVDGGHHSRDDEAARDARRTGALNRAGYRVLRFWNPDVLRDLDSICETILAALEGRA